jgi:serine/threonine protein kinase
VTLLRAAVERVVSLLPATPVYELSQRIGAGGMGEVYLATDITAGRKAALKLLPARSQRSLKG